MKAASLRIWACAILLAALCPFVSAAIVPLSSTVTFNLYGNDYTGPLAGIQRNPATAGPMLPFAATGTGGLTKLPAAVAAAVSRV